MPKQERTLLKKNPGIYRYVRYGKTAYGFVVESEPIAGKRRQVTRQGFSSLEAAEKERTALMHRRHTGDVVEPSRELLRDFFERWLAMRQPAIRDRTALAYRGSYSLADPYLGAKALRDIRADHIQACVSDLTAKGYAPRTVRKMVDILRRVFTAAVRWGLLHRSPAVHLDLPRIDGERRQMLTADELRRLVEASASSHWGLLIRTLVETWMRAGEVCDLRWGAVDLERGVIRVERSLSGKIGGGYVSVPGKSAAARRDITISPTLARLLAQEKERQRFLGPLNATSYVFRASWGGALLPTNLNRPIKRYCRAAGIPEVSPHWIRHSGISVARLALKDAGDIVTISQRAGHEDIKTTLGIYSHTRPEQHSALGTAFGALLDAQDQDPEVQSVSGRSSFGGGAGIE